MPKPMFQLLLVVVLSLCGHLSDAATIAADSFLIGAGGYTAGAGIRLQPASGTGLTGNWSGSTGLARTVAGSLSAPAGLGIDGGRVRLDQSGFVSADRNVSASLAPYATSSTYWFSGIISATNDPDGTSFVEWLDNDHAADFGLRVGFAADNLVLRYRDDTEPLFNTIDEILVNGYVGGLDYFFIANVDVDVSGARDDISIWINPLDVSSAAALGATTSMVTAAAFSNGGSNPIDQLMLSTTNFGGGIQQWDELRYGTAFADVAPQAVPEPSTLLLSILVLATGFTCVRKRKKAPGQ